MNINKLIESLTSFDPQGSKFISIYLDAASGVNGRDDYASWLKTQFYEYSIQFENDTELQSGYKKIEERVNEYLESDVDAAANGIAIFASVDGEVFETIELDEPFPNNRFFVFDRPHIFPLVRMVEQNPKYAVLWADTNKAAIYVFGGEEDLDVSVGGETAIVEQIQNEKTSRSSVGGWSQARYQRHIENFHLQHAKETAEEIEKVMRERKVDRLVLCGDETGALPILRPQLAKETEAKIVAVLNLSQYATEGEIRDKTRQVLAADNSTRDAACVERALGAAKAAAGLGAMGVETTLAALSNGQVEELVIASDFDAITYDVREVERVLENYAPGDDNSAAEELPAAQEKRQIADELLVRAVNSGARVVFIEDGSLLEEAGGVAAVLRYSQASAGTGQ